MFFLSHFCFTTERGIHALRKSRNIIFSRKIIFYFPTLNNLLVFWKNISLVDNTVNVTFLYVSKRKLIFQFLNNNISTGKRNGISFQKAKPSFGEYKNYSYFLNKNRRKWAKYRMMEQNQKSIILLTRFLDGFRPF